MKTVLAFGKALGSHFRGFGDDWQCSYAETTHKASCQV